MLCVSLSLQLIIGRHLGCTLGIDHWILCILGSRYKLRLFYSLIKRNRFSFTVIVFFLDRYVIKRLMAARLFRSVDRTIEISV